MSAIKQAQEKVMGLVAAEGDPSLVATFDFSILIDLAMKYLMQYLGNCMSKDEAAATAKAKDGFWYSYFVQKASKDAVETKHPKHERSREARRLLANTIEQVSPAERQEIVTELQEAHDDAGMLF